MTTRKSSQHRTSERDQAPRSRKSPVDEDPRFQRRQWFVERIGWMVMIAIVTGALAGAFGGRGPLAIASATSADGNTVQYARFARYTAPTTLDVKVGTSNNARQIRLSVSEEYLSAMTVRAITPPPTSTALADRQHVFVFERSSMPSAATIRFELEPTTYGPHRGWISVNDGAPVSFTHFIYP